MTPALLWLANLAITARCRPLFRAASSAISSSFFSSFLSSSAIVSSATCSFLRKGSSAALARALFFLLMIFRISAFWVSLLLFGGYKANEQVLVKQFCYFKATYLLHNILVICLLIIHITSFYVEALLSLQFFLGVPQTLKMAYVGACISECMHIRSIYSKENCVHKPL